jgi:hypothetical protein
MIRPDQIPDEAWEAAMKTDPRDGLRAAIAAALNAWPGAAQNYNWDGSRWRIVLPNEQEGCDE